MRSNQEAPQEMPFSFQGCRALTPPWTGPFLRMVCEAGNFERRSHISFPENKHVCLLLVINAVGALRSGFLSCATKTTGCRAPISAHNITCVRSRGQGMATSMLMDVLFTVSNNPLSLKNRGMASPKSLRNKREWSFGAVHLNLFL